MLFIRRNLSLKILQMLQNGLIFLTIWSLMRMVNFSHDFDFLIVNFPYLSSNISESPAYGVFFCLTVNYVTLGLVQNMKMFGSEDLFWFQSDWNKDIPHGLHFGSSMVAIQTLFTNLTPLCHICLMICSLTMTYDWFPVVLCKSWRVLCSFRNTWFHSLWGVHDFTHSLYICIVHVWICQFNDYVDWLMTLVCLSGCFVSDLFHKVGICVNISLNNSNNLWEVVSDHYLL